MSIVKCLISPGDGKPNESLVVEGGFSVEELLEFLAEEFPGVPLKDIIIERGRRDKQKPFAGEFHETVLMFRREAIEPPLVEKPEPGFMEQTLAGTTACKTQEEFDEEYPESK